MQSWTYQICRRTAATIAAVLAAAIGAFIGIGTGFTIGEKAAAERVVSVQTIQDLAKVSLKQEALLQACEARRAGLARGAGI